MAGFGAPTFRREADRIAYYAAQKKRKEALAKSLSTGNRGRGVSGLGTSTTTFARGKPQLKFSSLFGGGKRSWGRPTGGLFAYGGSRAKSPLFSRGPSSRGFFSKSPGTNKSRRSWWQN